MSQPDELTKLRNSLRKVPDLERYLARVHANGLAKSRWVGGTDR